MADVKQKLIKYMEGLDVIDCHEHLAPENRRVGREADVLMLVSLYAWFDTVSAGLPTKGRKTAIMDNHFLDLSVPLEQRWKDVWPYLKQIKYGSYYRPTAIALKDIYGIDDLNESTYQEASRRIQAANKPGLYRKILQDRSKIKTCIIQNGMMAEGQDPPDLFTPLLSEMTLIQSPISHVKHEKEKKGTDITDLDGYLEFLRTRMSEARQQTAVGFKIAAWPLPKPNPDEAKKDFEKILSGAPATGVLQATILDFILQRAEEWDWPVAVHCGIWGDYRTLDPKNFIDSVMKYPKVRFDLYHLGMPFARDIIFIAKNFPNAYLDLCWCYAISQEITRRTINEILDTVPVNKVFAFGADYIYAVENVYGHLVMARETIAEALSERIASGKLDVEGAKHIAKLWLYDNPCRFYGLKFAQ